MPELPEVETTCRGVAPWVEGQRVCTVLVRQPALRWPVPATLAEQIEGKTIHKVSRRGKYLLLSVGEGHVLVHLGMSGSLRMVETGTPARTHDHVDFMLANGKVLRYHDPRRFGCILWVVGDPTSHALLADLGPEPLSDGFSAAYLFSRSRKRQVPIKQLIMDSQVVVGVGNIYANEALFLAGILPLRKAGSISMKRYAALVQAIRQVLADAIEAGGTTLRDFVGGDGKPGYFRQSLHVYGRGGEACGKCGRYLTEIRLGQRSTVYCPVCQR
jgi:formamidopyrimidine-DNA glycosylase